MEKRLPAAQHHFRPPAAPAAYSSTLLPAIGYRSSGWLPNGVPFLLEPAGYTGWPAPSRLAQEKCMRMRFSAASGRCLPSVHCGECASQGASAASCCGRIRPPGAPPSLLESAHAMFWPVQCRFGAEECMRWLCGTPPAGWVLHPRTGPSRARGGANPAVFRSTQGRGRARPHQARAWGYSP